MSAIEASLRLEIAQYQQQLAKATGAVQKFKEDARANSKDMGRAIMGPPDSWALSASHRSALRSSLTGAGQEGGGMLGSGIMSGMGRTAGPAALAAGLIIGLKKPVRSPPPMKSCGSRQRCSSATKRMQRSLQQI